MNSLDGRLKSNGCVMDIEDFQDALVSLLAEMFPSWSIDEMLLHPSDAVEFCATARRKTGCYGVPDDLVLRCLMSRRKNPNG